MAGKSISKTARSGIEERNRLKRTADTTTGMTIAKPDGTVIELLPGGKLQVTSPGR